MEAHEELLNWADAQGIQIHGIRPDRIPGRGMGIIATKKLKAGEVLLRVPFSALRTKFTIPKSTTQKLPKNMSVHGLLAADLALDNKESGSKYKEWNAVMPTPQDFETMPFTWEPELRELLPCRARKLLRKQESKFARDWEAVSAAFPSLSREDYRYAWMLANTRTFYYICPQTEKLPREDRMVLQPVTDLFNHADRGCLVSFTDNGNENSIADNGGTFDCHANGTTSTGFTIRADRDYNRPGEELFICYGNHSNDFLLAEYGFVLDDGANRFDECCLDDDVLLPRLSADQKSLLAEHDFLGNYMLDTETACYRTEVAVRLLCTPPAAWRKFVDGGSGGEDDTRQKARADDVLVSMLQRYRRKIKTRIGDVEDPGGRYAGVGTETQRQLLAKRWRQIDGLVAAAIETYSAVK